MRLHFKETYNGDRKVAYKQQVLRILFEEYEGKTVSEILHALSTIDKKFLTRIFEDLDIHAITEIESYDGEKWESPRALIMQSCFCK